MYKKPEETRTRTCEEAMQNLSLIEQGAYASAAQYLRTEYQAEEARRILDEADFPHRKFSKRLDIALTSLANPSKTDFFDSVGDVVEETHPDILEEFGRNSPVFSIKVQKASRIFVDMAVKTYPVFKTVSGKL